MLAKSEYAILVLDRETEDDPNDGIVMYTRDGIYWHAMVQGHMDWCNEVVDALCYRENDMEEKRIKANEELRAYVAEEGWKYCG